MVAAAAERATDRRIDLVIDRLSCPVCHGVLTRDAATLCCTAGHSFDLARQGYVALLSGRARANTADTAQMVAARDRFLGGGHYAPVATAIVAALPETLDGMCVDLAGGTGYYLGAALDARPLAVGLCVDLSAPALRRAAQAHPRSAAIAADAWTRLPLLDRVASVVLSVFGPRSGSEIARVLDGDGVLVVVTPTRRHLNELVAPLGMISVGADKSARLDRSLPSFDRESSTAIEYLVHLERPEIADLVMMGPSAHHVDEDALAERIHRLPDRTAVTVSVEVSVYRPTVVSHSTARRPDRIVDHTMDAPDLGGVRTANDAEG